MMYAPHDLLDIRLDTIDIYFSVATDHIPDSETYMTLP